MPDISGRWPLMAMGSLVVASIVAVAAVRATGNGPVPHDAATRASAELRFLDRPDGSIAVVDASNGRVVDQVVGESGFVRGTLRGLARERKRQGIGNDAAFRLIARVDGRLTLIDPATGRRVDLESFGPTNAGAFSRMLGAALSDERGADHRS